MQKYLKIILIVLIPLIVYLTSFGFHVYDDIFYTKLTDKVSNMPEMAEGMNLRMVVYFLCDSDTPVGFEDFSEEEIIHLVDVKKVINGLIMLVMVLIIAFVILLNFAKEKAKIIYYGGVATIFLPILFIILPFKFLFNQMHNLFFAKGSWIFAADALLVNLYPAEFFSAFAKAIILTGFCLGLVITFLGWFSTRK